MIGPKLTTIDRSANLAANTHGGLVLQTDRYLRWPPRLSMRRLPAAFVDTGRVRRGAAKGKGGQPHHHDAPRTCADTPPRQAVTVRNLHGNRVWS